MRWQLVASLILATSLAACNLGSGTPEPLPTTPTSPPDTSSKPQVTIASPQPNAEYTLNDQILVSVTATDRIGVTRVQLFANGALVKTLSSRASEGDLTLSGVLDYQPRAVGEVRMQVLAFRGTVGSDPAEITVRVVDRQQPATAVVTQNIPSGPVIPSIPNDGVCRAMTTAGLNMRRAPVTNTSNVIRVLPQYTLAPIAGRLPDNSWWKIIVGTDVGWVSAQFTTISGNCLSVPVEQPLTPTVAPSATFTNTPPVTATPTATATRTNTPIPGRPDLIVSSISGEQNVRIPSGAVSVTQRYSIVVTNAGLGPSGQFNVTLRIGSEVMDLGAVSDLANGESFVLEKDVTFSAPGTYELRVDVDPENQVPELSEVNNRGDLTVVVQQN